jgi:hypothetical protein
LLSPPAPGKATTHGGLDDVLSGSDALVLDGRDHAAAPSRSAPAFDPSVLEDDDDSPLEMLDLAASPRSPAPIEPAPPSQGGAIHAAGGKNVVAEPLGIDPIEVLALADFGPSPRGWVDAAPYAIRVFLRRRELRQELARQRGLLVEAERGQAHVLTSLVETLKMGTSDTSRALVERLAAVDHRTAERGAALETASQSYSASVAQIDARIGVLEAQRLTNESAVSDASAELDQRRQSQSRAEARCKRVDIELRAAHEAARTAAGPDAKFAPPEYGVRIRDLETERDVRATELRPLQHACGDAAEALRAREAELRETRRQIAKLRDERHGLEKTAARQIDLRTAGAGEAERERLVAYAEAGRELLRVPGAVPLADATVASDAQRLVDERSLTIEKTSRALTAYDAQATRRGSVVLGAALVLTLLLLVVVVVRA